MKKILLLHAGGTIGMKASSGANQKALKPSEVGSHFLELVPQLEQIAKVKIEAVDNIDSSNVRPSHWLRWLECLKKNYDAYDGFVMTHGTDTMAYTGAAFSFALGKTNKPFVLTGSQRPLSDIRTDARDNLINAVEMACSGPNEVSICFGNELLRANRATKLSATDYVAFESFNFPRLAKFGVNISRNWEDFSKRELVKAGDPEWNFGFSEQVFCFKIFPGISGEILLATIMAPACSGVVLEAFGSGNVPESETSVMAMITRAAELGKPVVIVSQCPHGQVDLDLYDLGVRAKEAGAISAGDMTSEASVVKLMHGLGQGLNGTRLRDYFLRNVCGERSL